VIEHPCNCIIVIEFQRQVTVLCITLKKPSFLKDSGHTATDGMHQRFEFLDVWRLYPVKA
jgi:hypothetical protein